MDELLDIMQRLRDPQSGCPWDQKQTLESIFPFTLEEVYEVGDAIDRDDTQDLRKELGDLLFQIVFYAQIAKEKGDFEFADVVNAICEKMIRRHPHVFSDVVYANEAEQKAAWHRIKAEERAETPSQAAANDDFFADIPKTLTSLQQSQKILKKASTVGFDWNDWRPIIDKIQEELDEIIEAVENKESQQRIEEEVGDLFIASTNLARHLNVDAENATRKAGNKFAKRFNRMQELTQALYPDVEEHTLEHMDHAWEAVKEEERS
ncbi:MAG: Nucleoside triphosphate pyrophosphohydrolase MazG (EC [uncultured Thiotrichaceae bacterium]|uniref:Nucleoside triphosphate pyrophosphohydrolase MazG (EC) n=1 Tax=uncultured Thiotrichaceae bacterium TaxID=298394 RepID=A0A6S6SK14_9GAMM|nr:MAG: Nucleoside triphosphate pyrophosphohydrolase MazG (EC [uncultured Thiotrichaceae bacterium]